MDRTKENLRRIRAYNKSIRDTGEWVEEDHPRSKNGQFTSGAGESPIAKLAEATTQKQMGWFGDLTSKAKSAFGGKGSGVFDAELERKLAKCKTTEAVYRVFRNTGYLSYEALDRSDFPKDIEGFKACVRGLDVVFRRYPEMKRCLNAGLSVVPMSSIENAIAAYSVKSESLVPFASIKLAEEGFNNFAAMNADYNKSIEGKEFPQGTTVNSITTHEMGHAIANDIKRNSPKGFDFCQYLYYDVCGFTEESSEKEVASELSKYGFPGNKVEYKFEDFMCEGLSEGLTSLKPRNIASKITKEIDAYFAAKDKRKYIEDISRKSKKGWV